MSFFVYKSSAGSGKTYTLVREYLQLALAAPEPDYFRHILAITFTNKAADEMKDRVLKKLAALATFNLQHPTSDPLAQELKTNLKLDDAELAHRASKLLSHILHNYSDFSISTIDKFTHRILSTFSHDMRLPVTFNVEVESDELLTEAIDILLQKAGSDETLTKTLVEFAEARADEDKDWRIENNIFQLAKKILFDEEGHLHVESLKQLTPADFENVRKSSAAFCTKYENILKGIAQQALKIIADEGISLDDFYQGKNGIGNYFRKISELNFENLDGNSYVLKAVGEGIWYTDKKPDNIKASIDGVAPLLLECYQQIQNAKEQYHRDYLLYQLVAKNLYAVSVLSEVEKILSEIKTLNNTVHISEFNRLISGVVMYEPAPFIYERIGQRYKHYLVDEFQDTSVLQWLNLLPLLDEALALKHFNMVVGDGKQAIYRWRGGRVEQFTQLPQIFLTPALIEKNTPPPPKGGILPTHMPSTDGALETPPFGGDWGGDLFFELIVQRQQTLERNIEQRQLDSNYRSKLEVVNFNNEFFSFLSSKISGSYSVIYDNHSQKADAKNTGGLVTLDFIVDDDEYHQKVFEKTKSVIDELVATGFQLKDIAILTRKNTHASEIARYLLEHEVNVISSESLLLSQSAEVNFLISLLRFLYNSKDNIAEAETLYYLQKSVAGNLHKYLMEHHPQLHAQVLLKYPLYEVFEKMVSAFFKSVPDPYIQFFLDTVHSYTSRNTNDPGEFLQWWEQKKNKISIVVPQGINAVNVMTIHKSKGLEFPAVIYPFAEDEVDVKRSMLWLDTSGKKELAPMKTALVGANKILEQTDSAVAYTEEVGKTTLDFLNLLYVAFTRPVSRLYVLSPLPEKVKDNISSIPYALKEWLESKQEWQPDKLSYTIGTAASYVSKTETKESAYRLEQLISSDWREKLLISRNSKKLWEEDLGITWGNLFHTAISQIFTAKDVVPVLSAMKNDGLLKTEEEKLLEEKITSLLNKPEIKHLFAEGLTIKTEADILLTDGTWLRPDRVIINGKHATVIDFKTGKEKPGHQEQLAQYADKLREMGYESVEQSLVYIHV
ncbi:MAG: RecBCD enzyme subunit RecB [Bacteroidia bacterium]|nr:RecBCD enzyme subunit RecB [Bacteroidia bacterium]